MGIPFQKYREQHSSHMSSRIYAIDSILSAFGLLHGQLGSIFGNVYWVIYVKFILF